MSRAWLRANRWARQRARVGQAIREAGMATVQGGQVTYTAWVETLPQASQTMNA